MTQVSEDAAFVRYPPPALSQRARGFQPLLLVKVASWDARALSKSLQKSGICGGIIKKLLKLYELLILIRDIVSCKELSPVPIINLSLNILFEIF